MSLFYLIGDRGPERSLVLGVNLLTPSQEWSVLFSSALLPGIGQAGATGEFWKS